MSIFLSLDNWVDTVDVNITPLDIIIANQNTKQSIVIKWLLSRTRKIFLQNVFVVIF